MKNLKLPLIASPMFLISNPKMVIECCKNGVVGTFPALNQRTTEGFEEWVIEIIESLNKYREETGIEPAPFGVNLIVHPTNPRVMDDLKIIMKHKVPLVITSLGAVSDLVNAVHSYGGLVFHDVIKKRHAEKAAEAGVDGLILVSAGAGGHAGTLNPMAFINEIKTFFDKKIILSGAITKGSDIAAALAMGADYAYAGTVFINTTEANCSKEYQQMIIESEAQEIIYTAAVSGVNASFMKKSLLSNGLTEENWAKTKQINFGEELDSEAKAWKTIWSAGQGVGSIHEVLPVEKLIQNMQNEFKASVRKLNEALETYHM